MVETLLREEAEFDEDQHFILTEAVRYLVSEAPGTSLQVRAGQTLIERILSDSPLSPDDPGVLHAIRCWHQQQADLCIWLIVF